MLPTTSPHIYTYVVRLRNYYILIHTLLRRRPLSYPTWRHRPNWNRHPSIFLFDPPLVPSRKSELLLLPRRINVLLCKHQPSQNPTTTSRHCSAQAVTLSSKSHIHTNFELAEALETSRRGSLAYLTSRRRTSDCEKRFWTRWPGTRPQIYSNPLSFRRASIV